MGLLGPSDMRHGLLKDSDMGHDHFLKSTGGQEHFLNSTGRHCHSLRSTCETRTPPVKAPSPCAPNMAEQALVYGECIYHKIPIISRTITLKSYFYTHFYIRKPFISRSMISDMPVTDLYTFTFLLQSERKEWAQNISTS